MDRAREKHIQHLSGKVRAVREEEVEMCPVGSAVQPLHEPSILRGRRVKVDTDYPPTIGRAQELNPGVVRRIMREPPGMVCPILRSQKFQVSDTRRLRNLTGRIYGEQVGSWRHRYPIISIYSLVSTYDCPILARATPAYMDVVIRAQILDHQCSVPRRTHMAQKVDRCFNEQVHIRIQSHSRQKQKAEKNATNRGCGRTTQFESAEGDAKAANTEGFEHFSDSNPEFHLRR